MADHADVTAEIERKFEVAAAGQAASLDPGAALGCAVPAEPEERLLEAVYYDTPDLRLLADGVTLRRRTGGGDAGWHVKLPVAGDVREEVRLPLTRGRAHPPDELSSLVRAFARGTPVGPVAELRTHRRAWAARDEEGVLVAELVVDDVIGRVAASEENESAWREVEVELGPAAPPGLSMKSRRGWVRRDCAARRLDPRSGVCWQAIASTRRPRRPVRRALSWCRTCRRRRA